jgi:hypothetical protein
MQKRKWIYIILLVTNIICTSCKSSQINNESKKHEKQISIDSIFIVKEINTKPIVIPQVSTEMIISLDSILKLPLNAVFHSKKGQVSSLFSNIGNNNYLVTANCDSLIILVSNLETKIVHLKKENTELIESQKESQIITIKEPDGIQWFQIWLGRILGILMILYLSWKLIMKR